MLNKKFQLLTEQRIKNEKINNEKEEIQEIYIFFVMRTLL